MFDPKINVFFIQKFYHHILDFSTIEVSVQIRGSNGAEIQYMVVKFLDKKKHLFLGQTLSQQLFDRLLFISSYVMYF